MMDPMPRQILQQAGVRPASPALVRAFAVIARRRLRGSFRAVRTLHAERLSQASGPVIVYLNHPSWWDPLVCLSAARALLPGRANYAPISATALEKYGLFGYLGMFPVAQDSVRGAAQFLRAGEAVLISGGVLWITAQGHFTDVRVRPTELKSGLGALLARCETVTVIPMAVEYTFWNQRLPEALVSFGEPLLVQHAREHTSAEWTSQLAGALERTQNELAQEAMQRDEARFTTLLEGARGAAGLYGVWQRLRTRMRGERWKPDHTTDIGASEKTQASRQPALSLSKGEAKVGIRAEREPASADEASR
jgi:1-acyl-sn-glycerol-3-phosphate acyltransferase